MQYLSPSIVQIKDFCSEKNAIQTRQSEHAFKYLSPDWHALVYRKIS